MGGVYRFSIGNGGSLSATVGPRQAIAVHTGAKGTGVSVPNTAQLVPVLFSENATTTFGEVSRFFAGLAWHCLGLLFYRVCGAKRGLC